MTARLLWEAALVELSKMNAPSMLLQEFNYYINKAVNQYVNKRYNIYDINLQTTDDLRVLKATAILDAEKTEKYKDLDDFGTGVAKLFSATYEIVFPSDYLHLLNCVCIYLVINSGYKCYDEGDYVQFSAKRLTADSWSTLMNDYYNRPLPERPYYYIHNTNTQDVVPTNPYKTDTGEGTDIYDKYDYEKQKDDKGTKGTITNFPRTISLKGSNNNSRTADAVEKEIAVRYGNASKVRCEIRYGKDDTIFKLKKVLIDYIKVPLFIRLTQELVDRTIDTSQIMEFPDYVCQEIINELVLLLMERTADPRTLSNMQVSQSIANPTATLQQAPTLTQQQ